MISLRINSIYFKAEIFNSDFALLRTPTPGRLHEIGKAIYNSQLDFIEEVICTEVEICLKFNTHYSKEKLTKLESIKIGYTENKKTYTLPIWIQKDSKDWKQILNHSGLNKSIYIKNLLTGEYVVSMLGFLPGFLYIKGLAKELQIPRKTNPDINVPPGSIAVGGPYLGLYSLASPGGWNIIGQTPIGILNPNKQPFLDLEVGAAINLKEITQEQYNKIYDMSLTLKQYNANM